MIRKPTFPERFAHLKLADDSRAHIEIAKYDCAGLIKRAVDAELSALPGDRLEEAQDWHYTYGGRLTAEGKFLAINRQLFFANEDAVAQDFTFKLEQRGPAHMLCVPENGATRMVAAIPDELGRTIGSVAIARNLQN